MNGDLRFLDKWSPDRDGTRGGSETLVIALQRKSYICFMAGLRSHLKESS